MSSLRLTTATTAANPVEHDLYLDDSGQPEWIGGDLNDLVSYNLMIAQRVKCRLLFIRGEWYLDVRQGTPWRESVWIKGTKYFKTVIQDCILATPGVIGLSELEVSFDSQARTASVTNIVIQTDKNTIVTIGQLDAPIILEVPRG